MRKGQLEYADDVKDGITFTRKHFVDEIPDRAPIAEWSAWGRWFLFMKVGAAFWGFRVVAQQVYARKQP